MMSCCFYVLVSIMVNAPIHDLLIRLKNAYMARKKIVENIQYSKFKHRVLELLQKYTFIDSFEVVWEWAKSTLRVELHVTWNMIEDVPVVKMFSKPSRRRYIWRQDIRPVAWWRWIGILSTSQWLMASHEAKKKKIGWELIAEIY